MSRLGRAVVVAALAAGVAAVWLLRGGAVDPAKPAAEPRSSEPTPESRPAAEIERIAASRFVEVGDEAGSEAIAPAPREVATSERLDSVEPTGALQVTLAARWRPFAKRLRVEVGPAGPEFRPTWFGGFDVEGSARLGGITAGSNEVWVVSAIDANEPLAQITDVLVPARGVAADPRLENVELPASVAALDLTVVDHKNEPVPMALIRTSVLRRRESWPYVVARQGRAEVLLRKVPTVLEINSKEHRTEIIEAVPGKRTVTLKPAATVVFNLPVMPSLPSGLTLTLSVKLVRAEIEVLDEDKRRRSGYVVPFEVPGEQRLRLGVPGEYQACWMLRASGRRLGPLTAVGTPFKFRLADREEPQEVVLDCPTALIERAAADRPKAEK